MAGRRDFKGHRASAHGKSPSVNEGLRRSHALYRIFLLLLAAACSAPESRKVAADMKATPAADPAAAAAGVTALIREWSAAGAEGRWNDLKALYADDPDFYWVEQGRVAYDSAAAAAAGVDRVAAMNAMIRSDVDAIAVTPLSADAASFRAHTKIGFVSTDFSFNFEGAFTGVAVRRDGRWRFLQGHLSRFDPPPQ